MGRAVLVVGLVLALHASPAAATTLPNGFVEESLTTGTLGSATAVAFAPDGRQFITEKSGRVRVVLANGTVQSTPLLDLRSKVNSASDRGLLGIAADKDFATNGYLYLLYVYELNPLSPDTDSPMVSRLTRITVRSDNTLENPSNPETVILGTDVSGPCPQPDNLRDCIPADYKWHVIGTVRSDPVDGTLWLGNGDTHAPLVDGTSYRPYDERSLAGKIIHIDRQGRGLPGHPFCPTDSDLTHNCTKVYAKGFRNPFRFTLRPGKGPIVGDVGNDHREELDLVKPGGNYGWPCYEGDIRTPLYDQETRCQQEYAKEGTADAATAPNWSYGQTSTTGASIVAGPVYEGTRYPAEYRGDIFVGDYVQGWVKRLDIDSSERVTAVHDFGSEWGAGVDLQAQPGTGDITYVDLGWGDALPAAVRKFVYTGSVNAAPTARVSASPTSGQAPLSVSFTGSASSDPDGDPLTYQWTFGDGSTSAAADPTHTYSENGQYTSTLTVSDGNGQSDSESVTITVGNTAPTASITAPATESTFRAGQSVALQGAATDAEDASIPQSAYQWRVVLHHADHLHEFATPTGSATSFVPTTDHDADSYYEIRLTVTDSGGLQNTTVVNIRPQTSNLTLASSPPGAPIGYGGQADAPAPFTKVAAVGYLATISAAPSFVKDGVTYQFEGWSDGGAAQHAISVPAADTTLTATYVAAPGVTLAPEADARVEEATATTNYGSSSFLRSDAGADPDVETYLRFAVPSGQGAVESARLRVFAYTGTANGPAAYTSSNSWSENAITWGTRPARTGTATDDKGTIGANTWVEYDVSSLITTAGTHSLVLAGTSSDGVDFRSKEASADRPLLVVTFAAGGGGDTTPPTAPALTATAPSSSQVDLSWTAATDDVGVAGYVVERRLSGGTSWATIATLAAAATAYADLSVSPSTAYEYRVTASDAAGNRTASNIVALTTPASSSTALTLAPEADARVEEATPTTNYGGSTFVRTDAGADPDVESYLRFTVPPGYGAVQSARLRVYATTGTANGPAVYTSGSTWPETGITWDTRPPRTGSATDDKAAITTGTWVEYDVTSLIGGAGTHSLVLAGTSSDGVDFASKEASANKPQLVLSFVTGGTTTRTLAPGADARVQETRATTNYGRSNYLRTDGGTDPDVESYLQFTVPSGSGTIQQVKLRVYATTDTQNGPALYATQTGWTEPALTWSTRPPWTSAGVDDKAAIAKNSWVEYDVTSLVAGAGTYSFALATTSTDGVDFASKEASANRPLLVVTSSG